MIKHAKKECWESWLESATTKTIWQIGKAVKLTPSDGGRARVPPLSRPDPEEAKCCTNEEKSELLYRTFFPPPTTTPDYTDFEYPEEAFEMPVLTEEQILDVLHDLKDFKANGPDNLPNEVFKCNATTLTPFLLRFYNATFRLKYYPTRWKISTTVVLRKPQKPDYSIPGAYRPIALLNCISKILSSCIAQILVHYTEKHSLISDLHFLGRPGRATTDSLHLLVKTVKDAWRKKKTASILFLDIKAAFPSAIPEVLFHNLRKRGVPKALIDWLRTKLDGRRTLLKFDDFESELFTIISGIDQSCPLSVILFQFYNSDLPDIGKRLGITVNLNIDDTMAISVADDRDQANQALKDFMDLPGGANDWSREHNSCFALDKFALINTAPRGEDIGPIGYDLRFYS